MNKKCKSGYYNLKLSFRIFRRVIQSSHPVCNTIMLFGVIICLVSVILLGIDGRFVDDKVFPQVSHLNCYSADDYINFVHLLSTDLPSKDVDAVAGIHNGLRGDV